MDTGTSSRTTSFFNCAANLSWICPVVTIITFALLIFSGEIMPRKAIAVVASGALCLVALGLVFGVVALFGISKQGTKGILAPAIVGIIINGLLLCFVVASFISARFRAAQQHGSIDPPSVAAMWSDKGAAVSRRQALRLTVMKGLDVHISSRVLGPPVAGLCHPE